jgi:NADH dehydrogenase (ubiquinone) 1 alpha subcomplex subunit 6
LIQFVRSSPEIVRMYDLEVPKSSVIAAVKKQFVANANVEDSAVVDMLVVKGSLDLDETMMKWKGKSHIMGYIDELVPPKEKTFLEKFFEGN